MLITIVLDFVGFVILPLLLLGLALLGDRLVGARIRGTPYPRCPAAAADVVATAAAAPRPPTRPTPRLHRSNAVGFSPQMS
jgi:hypothetical protein